MQCLLNSGQIDILHNHVQSLGDNQCVSEEHYYLAIVLARQGLTDEALHLLRGLNKSEHMQPEGLRLAYRLMLHKASRLAIEKDWQALSAVIAEAMEIQPDGVNASEDFKHYKSIVPISHLVSGRREEALSLWEQELIDNPCDARLVHHLALAHYWQTQNADKADAVDTDLKLLWMPAIRYWVALQNFDSFWSDWTKSRYDVWEFNIPEDDILVLRASLIQEKFEHYFHEMMDDARQKNDLVAAKAFEECLTALLLERRSAQGFKQISQIIQSDEIVSLAKQHGRSIQKLPLHLLSIPGGVDFFSHFGLLPIVHGLIAKLAERTDSGECVAILSLLFSDHGLGQILVLIEDWGLPDKAIDLIGELPDYLQSSIEVQYLRSLALSHRAKQLTGHATHRTTSLNLWASAYENVTNKASANDVIERNFLHLLKELKNEIKTGYADAVLKEALRLKEDSKLNDAIKILKNAHNQNIDGRIQDYLCAYLCDQGRLKLGKKDYNGARQDFQHVLNIKPDYQTAKEGMGTTYNNEACSEKNHDKSIELFEKALKWDDSYTVKANLADEM